MTNNRPFACAILCRLLLRSLVEVMSISSMAIADLGMQKFEKKGWQIPLAPRAANQ